MEEHGLVKDESCWPIKRHLTGDGCRGNQPPESVSAVITEPTYSAVWSFLASLLNFDNNIESCWCLSVCVRTSVKVRLTCVKTISVSVCVCMLLFCLRKTLVGSASYPCKGDLDWQGQWYYATDSPRSAKLWMSTLLPLTGYPCSSSAICEPHDWLELFCMTRAPRKIDQVTL